MKNRGKNFVLLLWIVATIMVSPCCLGCGQQEYWTISPCEGNSPGKELKPEVAAELKQYAPQFSAYMTSAVDKASAGDYSLLMQLRNETQKTLIPFSREGITIVDLSIKSQAGSLSLRIYTPSDLSAAERVPVVIYMHGGGWTFGSPSGSDHIATGICRTSCSIVISVDYRLSPENPYPAGLDDCTEAIQWVRLNAFRYNGDPNLIYLAGDSAGGNIAASSAVCELMNHRSIKGAILYYPAVNLSESGTKSMKSFATGYGLDSIVLEKLIRCYIPDSCKRAVWGISPINADARDMPPVLIMTGQFDILRDDAKKFAEKLSAKGNRVRYICLRGVTHAYLDSQCCASEFQMTMKETAGFIFRTSRSMQE